MRICFVRLMPYPSTIGGCTTYMNDLIGALIKKNHEVYVVTSRTSQKIENPETPTDVKIYANGLVHRKFGKGFIPLELLYRFLFEIIFMIYALLMVKKLKPDVIHTQTLLAESFPFALFKMPFVVTIYGLYLEGFRELWKKRENKIAVFLSFLYKWMEEFSAKRAKLMIICTTKKTQNYYGRFGKTILLGSGITFSRFNLKNKKEKNLYFTLSRLTEQKGLTYLFNALEILDKKKIKIKLNIAGDGEKEYVKKLKERARKLKNIKINFLGWITGKRKLEICHQAGIFILPSIFEPFGITVLEAMASGCAIIASDCEGPRKVVKPSFGVLVSYSDEKKRAENFALAIEKSLKWNVVRMGKKAREEAKKYDYDSLVDEYIKIYEEARK